MIWIKVYKSIIDSKLYNAEPFSKWQAFEYMIIMATSREYTHITKSGNVFLKRGQLLVSERKLAKKFKWSRDKVHRFLSYLARENVKSVDHFLDEKSAPLTAPLKSKKNHKSAPLTAPLTRPLKSIEKRIKDDAEIEMYKSAVGTVITIKNYDLYQSYNDEEFKKKIKIEKSKRTTNRTTDEANGKATDEATDEAKKKKLDIRERENGENGALSPYSKYISAWKKTNPGYVLTSKDKRILPRLPDKILDRLQELAPEAATDEGSAKAWVAVCEKIKRVEYWSTMPLHAVIENYEEVCNDITQHINKN